MNYQTRKFVKQLGMIALAALIVMFLPRLLVASIMGIINLVVTVAFIWILWRILSPFYRDYRRRRAGRNRPQSWYSDRR